MTTAQGCIPLDFPFLTEFLASFSKKPTLEKDDESNHKALEDSEVNSTQYLTSSTGSLSASARLDITEDLSTGFLDGIERGEEIEVGADHGNHLINARLVAKKHFDGALDGSEVLDRVVKCIEPKGFTPENTLYAQSVCPDEINHEEGDITNIFAEYMGEVFHLGGLGGLPFCGRTGFSAFTHHVPDGGHCFILMAPHIGISETHALGKYTRDGQGDHEGAACGAAIGAFQHCKCGKRMPSAASDMLDYQMNFIIRKVNKVKNQIMEQHDTDDERMVALVHEIWKVGKTMMLDEIVHAHYGDENSKLLVLTGVQINMPRPYEDMFQPLSFTMMSKEKPESKKERSSRRFGRKSKKQAKKEEAAADDSFNTTKVTDLYEEAFGRKAPVLVKKKDTTTTAAQ